MKANTRYLSVVVFLFIFHFLFSNYAVAQVAINNLATNPDPSAILDLNSGNTGVNKGFLPPQLALTAINVAAPVTSPATGLIIYNSATAGTFPYNVIPGYYYWDGTKWLILNFSSTASGNSWLITGNRGTNANNNFIGTIDNNDLVFRTDSTERARFVGASKGITQFYIRGGNAQTDQYPLLELQSWGGTDLMDINADVQTDIFMGYEAGYKNAASENIFIGYQSGYNNIGVSNTAVGILALNTNKGNYNTVMGYQALKQNTTSYNNTVMGALAMWVDSSGYNNTAIGASSLNSNRSGNYNTATGAQSLLGNTTGANNTAVGFAALESNNANNNTAMGADAMLENSTGTQNTANGAVALYGNQSGSNNTASGYFAMYYSYGSENTAMGAYALQDNTYGHGNTAVGFLAQFGYGNDSNTTVIGYNASTPINNSVVLGNTDVTSIGGYASWSNLSDGRFKKDIQQNVPGLSFIMKLRPVTYHYDMQKLESFIGTPDSLRLKGAEGLKEKIQYSGFIAQDVEKAANEIGYDFSGVKKPENEKDHYSLAYGEFTVPLVKAVQEQQDTIQTLKKQIGILENENEKQSTQIKAIQTDLEQLKKLVNSGSTGVKISPAN